MSDSVSSSLVAAVFGALWGDVCNGAIEPGDPLTEHEVGRRYGVARSTAKACIDRAVSAGVLRQSARKSAWVPLISEQEAVDIYRARRIVESPAARALAHLKHVPIEAYEELAKFDIASKFDNRGSLVAADAAFHKALVDGVGSVRMSRMYAAISGEAQLLAVQVRSEYPPNEITPVVEGHLEIVGAISRGDGDGAATAVERHLDLALARYAKLLNRSVS